jgi:shikimate 5-dehydrogenase
VPTAAVLGWPLEHTRSPELHQAAYRAAGLRDWHYLARPTRPDELGAVLEEVRAGRLAGVNLTTPHKRAAVPLLDALEPPAGELGAVNTVWRAGGPAAPAPARLVGGNTDVAGALWALEAQLRLAGAGWSGEGPALLLGTGGVALAVALAWAQLASARRRQGLPTSPLTVAGRDLDRAGLVAAHAGPGAATIGWDEAAAAVGDARVLVQATTLTASGQPVPGQDRLGQGVRVLELNYGPAAQGLVRAAGRAGAAAAVDGLGMLCAQAAAAATLIAGIQADLTAMAAAVGLELPHHPVGRVAPA